MSLKSIYKSTINIKLETKNNPIELYDGIPASFLLPDDLITSKKFYFTNNLEKDFSI